MNEKEIIHFIELSIEHNAIPQEGVKWVKGLLDLYKQEKEENKKLHSQIDEHVYNGCDYELCNKKWKDKIKEIVDECIPMKENIFTKELEYTPNANANSFLTQKILELLKEEN